MLDFDRIIVDQGAALAAAADGADPAAPVLGTDWLVADLVDHVGRLSWFFAGRVRAAGGGGFYDTDRPADTTRVDWFRQGLDTLVTQLRAADPEVPVKTWAGLQPPSWLWRRMAHELTVHRWDAQAAAGQPEPIERAVAVDGIDELLGEFLHLADLSAVGGTLHLHATDDGPGGEWFLDPTGAALDWEHAHRKGDVAVRGPAGELVLVLWSRLPPEAVDVIGEAAVLDRWLAATSF